MTKQMTGAQLLVKCLEAQRVEYIFGIPGAKIDAVFDALLDSSIKLQLDGNNVLNDCVCARIRDLGDRACLWSGNVHLNAA